MIRGKRTFLAVSMSVLLLSSAIVSVWLMASAGVFGPGEGPLQPAPGGGPVAADPRAPFVPLDPYRVSQPRDPFHPLIIPPPTTTVPTDTTVPGETTTTVPGVTTTTTPSDAPAGILVLLREIRTEDGVLVAVVEVDDVPYTVRAGDTFATHFKVVSLTTTGGVFQFGDRVFSLAVGQSILK